MPTLHIGGLRPHEVGERDQAVPTKVNYTFSLLYQDGQEGYLWAGFRVISGVIYPPAVRYGGRKYFNCVYLPARLVKELYDRLQSAKVELAEYERATRHVSLSREAVEK